MDHVHYSDGTEGTQLREFLARQNDNSPLDDAPSPRTALLSTSESDVTPPEPRARASLRHRHTRERKTVEPGLSRRDLMRALIEHEREFKELKRAYSIALDRVETETQRASLAEQRALDLAVRLREATDLRLHAERDLARTREEINLYKMQYDVAQREIHRAQDIVKDVEARREDAEAAATRARGVARKLREERMIYVAREEGRRQGYQEGLSRGRRMGYDEGTELGYEEGMGETRGVSEGNYSRFIEEVGSDDEYRDEYADDGEDDRRHGRDDGGSVDFPHMVNFPGRTRTEDERLTPPSATPTVFVPVSTHPSSTGRASIPPSRTRVRVENRTPVPVPPVSAPPLPPTNPAPIAPQPVTQQPLAAPSPTRPAIIRPVSVHNAPPSPRHPEYSIPPDGWIPLLDAQNRIVIPPPHEFSRPASPLPPPSPSVTGSLGLPPPPAPSSQGFPPMGQPRDQRGPPSNPVGFSQLSYQQSNASSRDLRNHPLDRVSGLSTIQEANTETPSVRANGGRRSATPSRGQPFMAYSIPPTDGSNSPRSRDVNQRLANGLRYTDGTPVEWSHMPLENHQPPPYAMQPTTSQGGPQRRRPANLTIPAPLATPAATPSDAPRHRRSASAASGGTAPTNTSSFLGRHRRAASSGNSVPDINVAPPV
ncbi:hypothetical protein JAAARDRAFT_32077 [Jaapia argillacea MUCL 33604]|uniref:Uncharacterized protein n=1 Tax=Jaapia argillacea MUCL 33604 TaxID=933084 RepID=A0A067Q4I7_9AGAM|nr:hypothetical protein JAAARDRAFT_32077 [Jaapia argillacea MUCL 33604]